MVAFAKAFALDENNPLRIVTLGLVSEETINGGVSWNTTNIFNPGGNTQFIALADKQGTYQADPTFPDAQDNAASTPDQKTIYVGNTTQVFVTKDDGLTWSADRAPNLLDFPDLTISDLVVDPADRDTIYVTTEGLSNVVGNSLTAHVWKSTNAGQSWTDISDGLPDVPTWSLTIDPRTNDLYVGTDLGIYKLSGGSGTWESFGAGLPSVQVHDVTIDTNSNTLIAATNAYGVVKFYIDTPSATGGAVRSLGGANIWTGNVILAGPTTISSVGSVDLQSGLPGATLTISGDISDETITTANTLTKIGTGDVILQGDNTYGGLTDIQQGNLVVQNPNALGSPETGTIVESGAALELNSSLNNEPITLNGNGILPPFDGHYSGALVNISNSNTYTGTITLGSNSTIGAIAGQLTINSSNTYGIVDGGTFYQNAPVLAAGGSLGIGTTYYYVITAALANGGAVTSNVQGVTTTAAGQEINLSWTMVAGATSYSIYRSTTVNFAASSLLTTTTTLSTSYTDNRGIGTLLQNAPTLSAGGTLAAGTYYYVIAAVTAGQTIASNVQSITTTGGKAINLSWTPVAGATSYNVYRSATAGNFTNTLLTNVATTSFTDGGAGVSGSTPFVQNAPTLSAGGGLLSLTTYYYVVTAVTAAGETSASVVQSIATTAGNQTVNLTWAAVAGATSYHIYRSTTQGSFPADTLLATTYAPTTSYVDNGSVTLLMGTPFVQNGLALSSGGGIASGTTYYYIVNALMPSGAILTSNVQGITTTAANQNITVSWTAVAGAIGYNVYRSTAAGNFANTLLASPGGSTTSLVDGGTAVTAGSPTSGYYSLDKEGPGGIVVLASPDAYQGGTTVTAGVLNVQNSGALGSGGSTVVFAGAQLQMQQSASMQPSLTAVLGSGGELAAGTTYFYVITAITAAGTESIVSNEQSVVTATGSQSTLLSWNAVGGAAAYKIYRSTTSTLYANSFLAMVPFGTTTYTDNGTVGASIGIAFVQNTPVLASGGGYVSNTTVYYLISAVTSAGQTISSKVQSITTTAGSQEIQLSWVAIAGATQYNVYRSFTAGSFPASSLLTSTTASFTSYTDTGLTGISAGTPFVENAPALAFGGNLAGGVTYYYVVTALLASGQTTVSMAQSITTSPANQTVNLSWTAVAGATAYEVYRSITPGSFPTVPLTAVNAGTTSFTDAGTAQTTTTPAGIDVANQTLYLSGSGITNDGALKNIAGNNTWGGNIVLVPTPNYSPPTSANGVVAFYVDSGNSLALPGNISQGVPGQSPIQSAAVLTGNAIASFSVLPGNGGNGYTSLPTITVSGGGGSGANGTPVLTAGAVSAVTLTAGGSGYTTVPNVGVTANGGGAGAIVTAVPVVGINVVPTYSLVAGQTYYYVITAVNIYGESVASNEQSIVALGSDPQVKLAWTRRSGATAYNIYRSTISGYYTGASYVAEVAGTVTSYTDVGAATTTGSPNLSSSSGLADLGPGTLVLGGNNSYTGSTYVGYTFGITNVNGSTAPTVPGGVIDIQLVGPGQQSRQRHPADLDLRTAGHQPRQPVPVDLQRPDDRLAQLRHPGQPGIRTDSERGDANRRGRHAHGRHDLLLQDHRAVAQHGDGRHHLGGYSGYRRRHAVPVTGRRWRFDRQCCRRLLRGDSGHQQHELDFGRGSRHRVCLSAVQRQQRNRAERRAGHHDPGRGQSDGHPVLGRRGQCHRLQHLPQHGFGDLQYSRQRLHGHQRGPGPDLQRQRRSDSDRQRLGHR